MDPSIATATAIEPGTTIANDLKAHNWSAHPTVGYFSGTATVDGSGATASSHGFGETINIQDAVTDHLGFIFSGMNYSGSGSYSPGSTGTLGSSGSSNVSGWLLGAGLVLDPTRGNGFRIPFFIGLNYQYLKSTMPTSSVITSLSLSSPGFSFGFSPRFNFLALRIEPFLVVSTPLSKGTVTCSSLVVAGTCGALDIQVLPVYGVNLIFKPLNLSFYINMSSLLLGTGVSFYSLGPQFRF